MLKWWRTKRVYVKPVSDSPLFAAANLVVEYTPLQSFRDDRRRYGLRVAARNLLTLMTMATTHHEPQ